VGPGLSFVAPGVPDGTYWLRVRGSNAAGTGVPSQDLGVTMGVAGGCVGLPYAPVLQAPSISGSLLSLSWDAPGGTVAPTGYVLFAGSGPGRSDLAVLNLGAGTTFAANAPAGTYFLRVAGRSACGVGAASTDITASVLTGGGGGGGVVPVPPSGLTASVSGRVISLAWAPPTTGATPTSYVVDVGTISGSSNLGSFNTGSTATSVSGTVAPGRYFIRLRTRANANLSAPSSEVVVDVP
jgi:hypothetical protein